MVCSALFSSRHLKEIIIKNKEKKVVISTGIQIDAAEIIIKLIKLLSENAEMEENKNQYTKHKKRSLSEQMTSSYFTFYPRKERTTKASLQQFL
jgi:hypothetical protein